MENSKCSLKYRLYEAMAAKGKKAVDLTRDLQIPKSAISQYLSGKSQNMDSERLHKIASYLDVSEPWLMGYDVPMDRHAETKKEQPTEYDGLSKNRKALVDFAMSISEEKAEKFLRLLQSIEEVDL